MQTFAKVFDKLLIIVCGKSFQICCFIMSTNMIDMTWRRQWRQLLI